MRVDSFDFELDDSLIALHPAQPRSSSRILVADQFGDKIDVFNTLADHIRPGDLIVFNDTKVIPARLSGLRRRGEATAKIEVTLMKRRSANRWGALARPAKRLKIGEVIEFDGLSASVTDKHDGGGVDLEFTLSGQELDIAIVEVGEPPLPPYIAAKRQITGADNSDYQTMFASKPGAVAAPTASLHFEPSVIESLRTKGVKFAHVTLHVGGGTFLPIKVDDTKDHVMHAEWGEIDAEAAEQVNRAKAEGGRIIAAGTTALRLLESATTADGKLEPWRGDTDIFITPGYRFKLVDGLITNFHLPRSTLFMLVSALMGTDRMQSVYATAMKNRMRFYSYGDASLLWRPPIRRIGAE